MVMLIVSVSMSVSVSVVVRAKGELTPLDTNEDGKAKCSMTLKVHLIEGTVEELCEVIAGGFLCRVYIGVDVWVSGWVFRCTCGYVHGWWGREVAQIHQGEVDSSQLSHEVDSTNVYPDSNRETGIRLWVEWYHEHKLIVLSLFLSSTRVQVDHTSRVLHDQNIAEE